MYNGYKNFQTWSIFAYISNEESVYFHYQAVLKELGTDDKAAELAEVLRHDFKEELPEDIKSPYNKILEAALEDVDFIEVAKAFLDN